MTDESPVSVATASDVVPTARSSAWSQAWSRSQFGEGGFYRTHRAEQEFTTSVHVDRQLAQVLAKRIEDERQRSSDRDFAVIDIGAGDGTLLRQLQDLLPTDITYVGVDMREPTQQLTNDVTWIQRSIDDSTADITGRDGEWSGVLLAHEFLDDIPCEVVELDESLTPHAVLVDPTTGAEQIGPALDDPAASRFIDDPTGSLEWLERWWPATRPLARREIGLSRDRVWRRLRNVLARGTAIAIDYSHTLPDRRQGVWDGGTLQGFARGRPRRPIPDGSMNITAHVALDSCAGGTGELLAQSSVLTGLAGLPGSFGSHRWLIDPVVQR